MNAILLQVHSSTMNKYINSGNRLLFNCSIHRGPIEFEIASHDEDIVEMAVYLKSRQELEQEELEMWYVTSGKSRFIYDILHIKDISLLVRIEQFSNVNVTFKLYQQCKPTFAMKMPYNIMTNCTYQPETETGLFAICEEYIFLQLDVYGVEKGLPFHGHYSLFLHTLNISSMKS